MTNKGPGITHVRSIWTNDSLIQGRLNPQKRNQGDAMSSSRPFKLKAVALIFFCLAFSVLSERTQAATLNVPDGDVAGLIAAINAANASPAPNTINLAAGGTYTLTAINNGVNGLPAITNDRTINGNGATIQRSSAPGTPDFRIFHVLSDGTVTFSGLTIGNARGTGDSSNSFLGGGIFNRNNGTVNITNCIIIGNTANYGGGIANPSGTLNILNSTISHNSVIHPTDDPAGGNGGGINNSEGAVNITNSTISDNSSNTAGGGIFQYAGTVKITNSTITGNSCNGAGGGIHHNDGGTTEVTNSTITGNSSGLYNNGSHGGTATLRNTIVALNTVVDLQGLITSYGHNLLGTTSGVTITPQAGDQFGVTASQLNLGQLANNDGPTQTIGLLCGSVAIDAGDDSVLNPPLSLSTDQRGNTRKVGSHVDVGAFELAATPLVLPNLPGSPQSFNWVIASTPGSTPSPRYGHGMVYDSAHSKVILFGGQNAQGVNNNEVWELDSASNAWTNVTPSSGSMPTPRFNFGMVYDSSTGKVLIYGGQLTNIGPSIAGDTWEWNPATYTWLLKSNTSSVGNRLGSGMAYDPNIHQVILFGGRDFSSFGNTLTGTYTWDGNTWQQLSTPVGPIGRYTQGMVTDSARSKVVMYGGYNGNLLGDTWEWNGTAWTLVAANGSGPFMRSGPGLAYDSGRQRTVMFGGSTGQPAADTWEWNGTSWTQLPTQAHPSARSSAMVYDSAQSKLVIFSGDGFAQLADTWYSQTTSGLPTITGECSASVSAPTAMDSCDGPITGTTTDPTTYNAQGTYTVHWTYNDGHGNSSTQTQTVIVKDTTPPTVTAPPNVSATTGAGATSCGVVIGDAILGTATASDNCATVTPIRSGVPAGNNFPVGNTTLTYTATDGSGHATTATQIVTVSDNTPPNITCPVNIAMVDNVAGSCGALVSPEPPATSDNCGVASVVGTRSDGQTLTALYPVGATTVDWVATDASGNTASCLQTITVTNPAPVVSVTGPSSGSLYAVNTPVNFTGSFTDNLGDSHTAVWTFDGVPQAGIVDETTQIVSASHTFGSAGVFLVTLTVTDECGQTIVTNQVSGFDALIVIYDPDADFVTGGGWINSPAGAYAPNPSLVGKANFGFVSKYKKGANVPDGQTEFQFKIASLNFRSTIYEWLVVAGAKAQYKGSGTINGAGNYGFMLTAIDGEISGGGGIDKFRIKIWDKSNGDAVVYDNQMGAGIDENPTTSLAGGSIVIHK